MFLDKPVKGIRKLRHSSLKPGSSMEKTSMESLLSQLQGAPSPQIPTPINFCCNVVSTDSTCCLVRGSMPVFSYSLSKLPMLTNCARISKGNKTAICCSSSCPVLIFFTLTQQMVQRRLLRLFQQLPPQPSSYMSTIKSSSQGSAIGVTSCSSIIKQFL